MVANGSDEKEKNKKNRAGSNRGRILFRIKDDWENKDPLLKRFEVPVSDDNIIKDWPIQDAVVVKPTATPANQVPKHPATEFQPTPLFIPMPRVKLFRVGSSHASGLRSHDCSFQSTGVVLPIS